jgi:hypothetical protein
MLAAELGHDPDPARLAAGAAEAVFRAYRVAWALRDTDIKARDALRERLGWIAVSGEDDAPHRPVNVLSAPYPQYDVAVTSHGQTFQIRTMIASPGEGP